MFTEQLNGVKIHVPESRRELMEYALKHKSILVAVNGEKIHHATNATRRIINRNVGYPDGMGAVWALQRKGHSNVFRIPGCELWLDIIREYHSTKTFYLVGGKKAIIEKTVNQLRAEYPDIKILNYRDGYINNDIEHLALIDDISQKKPDIVFVAMGSPRQELIMEDMYQKHAAVYQGLGGSFDVYAGQVLRAPKWWVKNNLEGVYRTMMEPRKRIMRDIRLIPFFIKLLFHRI